MLSEPVPRKQRSSKKALVLAGILVAAACLSGTAVFYGTSDDNSSTVSVDSNFTPLAGRSYGFLGYYFHNSAMTWNQARSFCQSRGMVLATVDSPNKRNRAKGAARGNPVWIGYRSPVGQQNNKGVYRWVAGMGAHWADWDNHEPNKDARWPYEYCTEMRPNGRFNNLRCDTARLKVLCDRSPYFGSYAVHGLYGNVNWDDANSRCRVRYGSTLATSDRLGQMRNALAHISTHSAWVGVRIEPFIHWHAQGFGYASGVGVSTPLRWLPNEPNNYRGTNERCGEMVKDGRLNDLPCGAGRKYYVCDRNNRRPAYAIRSVERMAPMNPRRNYKVPAKMLEYRGRRSTKMTFQIRINGLRPDWAAIFHVGNVNTERNPGIWTYPGSRRITFRQSSVQGWNVGCDPPLAVTPARGQWFRATKFSGPGLFEVRYGDAIRCQVSATILPPASPQSVYIGDPWYEPALVTVRDLRFMID